MVFLTDEAIPASPEWLATLVSNFEDPRVGGAYCRNAPRPEADLLAKIFSSDNPTYAMGRRELLVHVPTFANESRLLFGGRILADVEEVGRISPFSGCGIDEVRRLVLRAHLPTGAQRLRIEGRNEPAGAAGEHSILRIRRIELRRPGSGKPSADETTLDRTGLEADAEYGQIVGQGVDASLLGPDPSALE